MNWKKLLKDKAGLTKSAKFLLTTVGAGAVAFYTLSGVADEQVQQERALRDLSSMSASSPYAGLRQSTGGLSSINVKDARGQLATASEREAMERNSGANGDFGQGAVESLNSGSVGQAMQFSDSSEGLTMGGDKGAENAARFASGADAINMNGYSGRGATGANASGAAGAGADGSAARASYTGNGGRSGGAGQLGSASMARASGSSSSSSYNPANPSGGSPVTKARGGESAYQMSGAMPDGSTILAMGGSHNPKRSGFSSSRDLQAGPTQRNGHGNRELSDIMEKSIAAADNTARSANEGGRAFHAGQTRSTGLSADTMSGRRGASSTDLSPRRRGGYTGPRSTRLKLDSTDARTKWDNKRADAVKDLKEKFISNILIALGIISVGSFLLTWLKGLKFPYAKLVYWGVALMLFALVATLMYPIFEKAHNIIKEFSNPPSGDPPNNTGIILMEVFAGITLGGMAATAIWPTVIKDGVSWLLERAMNLLPMQVVQSVGNEVKNEIENAK